MHVEERTCFEQTCDVHVVDYGQNCGSWLEEETEIFILGALPYFAISWCMQNVDHVVTPVNASNNKDMYVINAMVYQVGILTNETENETRNINATGNQETLTFYHNNGSKIDLSSIPAPLLTNVTAHSLVGTAPVPENTDGSVVPWSTLKQLATTGSQAELDSNTPILPKKEPRDVHYGKNHTDEVKGSLRGLYKIFKRGVTNSTPVKIVKGSAVIPEAAGVQTLAIPSLITLNNNFSKIPVPIPNTSVVHYAKINTLITKP